MENRFQSAHEIAKVYHALNDRESLQVYFLQSLSALISANASALYLSGNEDKLWLEVSEGFGSDILPRLKMISEGVQTSGKLFLHKNLMGVPLVAGSRCFGVALVQKSDSHTFSTEDSEVAISLGIDRKSTRLNSSH